MILQLLVYEKLLQRKSETSGRDGVLRLGDLQGALFESPTENELSRTFPSIS